ncbi:hypothetical protein H0H87_003742 [Tephrocybe sp. NHM501043]|nr:hypothetical protein H0H87_003742 [Tephrocybe sp. NHM501043]
MSLSRWAKWCTGAYTVGKINDQERFDVVRHACPGAGACGGMYTANTMSSALEKKQECAKAARYLKRLLELDIKPR